MFARASFFLVPFLVVGCQSRQFNVEEQGAGEAQNVRTAGPNSENCDVIVVGGTTSATAAAIASAEEFRKHKKDGRVCLLEPTNWPGGQLTASGVAAIDFDHHTKDDFKERVNLSTLAVNNSNLFAQWARGLGTKSEKGQFTMDANRGRCWVSVRCYEPSALVPTIKSKLSSYGNNLKVYCNTVPKSVVKSGRQITAVSAIVRSSPGGQADGSCGNEIYDSALSNTLPDWYSPADSARHKKKIVEFKGNAGFPVVVDATEWGEVLALSDAEYTQGLPGNETCGQAIVYPLALQIQPQPTELPNWFQSAYKNAISDRSKKTYSHAKGGGTWEKNWRYRRMKFGGQGTVWNTPPATGDITQINVAQGNDYEFEYLFPSKAAARSQISNWQGGVRIEVLRNAEIHALGYAEFMRNTGGTLGKNVTLSQAFGTVNGLSKVPYMRDTRRSVGINGYQISYESELLPGKKQNDSIGIGVYVADVHPLTPAPGESTCRYPEPSNPHPKPFYLPLRALTNKSFDNLLVGGKTMAQDFLTNAATRLHPIEFASGTAAGVAAVFMNQFQISATTLLSSTESVASVQTRVRTGHGPIDWTR
jgi:hypothetical protein